MVYGYVSIQPFVHRQLDRAASGSVNHQRLFIVAPCIQMEFHYKEPPPMKKLAFLILAMSLPLCAQKHT
jgi:hypothetical protein